MLEASLAAGLQIKSQTATLPVARALKGELEVDEAQPTEEPEPGLKLAQSPKRAQQPKNQPDIFPKRQNLFPYLWILPQSSVRGRVHILPPSSWVRRFRFRRIRPTDLIRRSRGKRSLRQLLGFRQKNRGLVSVCSDWAR